MLTDIHIRPAKARIFKTLDYLYSISGSKTVSGQHNREPNSEPAKWTNEIHQTTGKFPALWSGDFLFEQENIANRWTMINEAKRQWDQGAIVNIMYHACPPTQSEACAWDGGVISHLSDSQWSELITNGSHLNNIWKSRLDSIAPYLQYLEDNGVEVLFRPLHEMNQGAFWWGGRAGPNGTRKLYEITHDYLVINKGLSNLIWVWDVQDLSRNFSDYKPGDSYWDVAALDVYDGSGFTQQKYNDMLAVAGGKPIAIGECATLPTPATLTAQPRWAFFMAWAELVYSANATQQIQTLYNDARVLTLDELPGWNNIPTATPTQLLGTNLARGKAVTSSSNESTSLAAANAVDGNTGTRWSSLYSDPQWLRVDLGATYDINRIILRWEAAYGKSFQVQVSNDDNTWTTVFHTTTSSGGVNDLSISGSGRYVRMYGIQRGTQYGYSLWEFEVYSSSYPVPPSSFGVVGQVA